MARPPGVSFGKDLGWRIEALAFDLLSAALRPWPIARVSGCGGRLLRLIGPLTGAHRLAERNLRLAFPHMAETERERLLREQWDNLGRTFFEFPLADRLTPERGRVEVQGMERLQALASTGKGAVLVSGHFANWEVMAAVIVASGLDCRITYRAANNPYFDRRIIEGRARYGVKLFAPKGGAGSRDLLKTLQDGQSVAFLNDQKFNGGSPPPSSGIWRTQRARRHGWRSASAARYSPCRCSACPRRALGWWCTRRSRSTTRATASATSRRACARSTPSWRPGCASGPASGSGSTSAGRTRRMTPLPSGEREGPTSGNPAWEGEGRRRVTGQTWAAAVPLTLPSPRRGEG